MSEPIDHTDEERIRNLLVGRRVVAIEMSEYSKGSMTLDDGTLVTVYPNLGCPGCSSGGYEIESLNRVDNVITRVDFEEEATPDPYGERTTYRIFVLAEHERLKLLEVEGDDGNGYYGTGYELVVGAP